MNNMRKNLFKSPFKKGLLTVIGFLLTVSMFGQKMSVSGTVVDENKEALPGVQVYVKGTAIGTITDFDGMYELNVDQNSVLEFNYVGYLDKQEVVITGTINVQMAIDRQSLDEVVVIGYGSVKRKDLTGAVVSLDVDDMVKAPVSSFDEALAGRMSGVQVTSSEGRPGAPSSIKIRGTGSLTQSSSPLFVVDGFPIDDFDISSLAPSDIESMEVLKGPSAVAIYGSRGGNGVILITTVSGVDGKSKITYNTFYGIQNITKRIDVMTPYDFVDLRYEVDPVGAENSYGPLSAYLKNDGTSISGIDWQNEVFNQTEVKSHALSVNGGNSDTRYNLSFSNYSSGGLLDNSGFKRNYAKLKLDQKVSKKVKIGTNISFSNTETTGTYTSTNILNSDGGSSSSGRFNLLKDIVQGRPTGGLFYSNEELLYLPEDPETEEGAPITNPLVNANTQTRIDERNTFLFNGYLQYTILNGLVFKANAGVQKTFRRRDSFDSLNSAFERRNGFTRGSIRNEESTRSLLSTTLNFKRKYDRLHSVNCLIGFDYSDILYKYVIANGSDFPEPNLGLDDLGFATEPSFSSSYRAPTNTLLSFFYRLNYVYDGKYFFTSTLRRDGSSRFGPNQKFGFFPSMSVAWRFSDENFLSDSKVINDGKLRFEWGQVGNNRIPASVSKPLLITTSYGVENGTQPAVRPDNLSNPDIKWEAQEQINLGVDLGMFGNRVLMNVDVYSKKSKDLLLRADLPTSIGFSTVYRNIGEIQNQGLEFSLSTINIDKEFKWSSNLNLTFPKNKTIALVDDDTRYDSSGWYTSTVSSDPYANDFITQVGESFGLMYGYVDDGLYRAEDFDENGDAYIDVTFNDEELGFRKYKDLNGDNKIDEKDKKVLGNPNPIFFGGLANNLSYKNFDLSVFFQWSYGNEVYNANRLLWTSNMEKTRNFIPEILNRWRTDRTEEENANTTFRSIDDKSQVLTSQYIEDASYIRLKTISLGYTFPKKWINKVKAQNLKIYVTGQNLFTWTNYSGYDPEVSTRGSGLTSGVDFGAYPRSKTFIGGLSVTF